MCEKKRFSTDNENKNSIKHENTPPPSTIKWLVAKRVVIAHKLNSIISRESFKILLVML